MAYKRMLGFVVGTLAIGAMLAGCQTTSGNDARAALDRICQVEPAAHGAFRALIPVIHPTADVIAIELRAHRVVEKICENPPADIAAALRLAQDAWAIVSGYEASAKAAAATVRR